MTAREYLGKIPMWTKKKEHISGYPAYPWHVGESGSGAFNYPCGRNEWKRVCVRLSHQCT